MKFLITLILALSFNISGFAAPLNTTKVPLKAKWYLHIDVENLKNSDSNKFIFKKILEDPNLLKLQEVLLLVGVELSSDIKGLTLYGMEFNETDWLLAIDGKFSLEKLLAFLKMTGSYEVSNSNGFDVYKITNKDEISYFYIYKDILHFSKNITLINDHISLMMGDEKSIRMSSDPLRVSLNNLTVTGNMNELPKDGQDDTIKEIDRYVTKIAGGVKIDSKSVVAEIVMETRNSDSAVQLNDYLKVILGMAKLNSENKPKVNNALKTLTITRLGNKIVIKNLLSKEDFIALVLQKENQVNDKKRAFAEDEKK